MQIERQPTQADREATATRLREAFVSGSLTHEDFNARLEAALGADTVDGLSALVRDLPAPAATAGAVPSQLRLAVTHGSVDRLGVWDVPGSLELQVGHAAVTLDFREPELPESGVHLSINASSSRIVLLVRAHAALDYQNLGRHRSKISDRTRGAGTAASVPWAIRISGDLRNNSTLLILPPRRGLLRR